VRSLILTGLLPIFLALSACSSDDSVQFFQPVTADPSFPGTPGDPANYQNLLAYSPNPDCTPTVPRVLNRKTEIRLFRGYGITQEMAVRFAGGLARYYDPYGVKMYTRHEIIQVPLDHLMVLNSGAISDRMSKSGTDPSCMSSSSPSTACEQAMGAAMFYNLKEFFHAYAEPAQTLINVVLLKRIAALDPDESEEETAWGVAGLGLSVELMNSLSNGSDVGSLGSVIDEDNFSPTIFIGSNLVDFVLKEPDMVIAHELGHAYGLEHVSTDQSNKSNLMYPVAGTCQSLSLSQLSTIENSTARYGNSLLATYDNPLDFLSFEHRAPEILEIVRKRIAQRNPQPEARQ
jgi:hypothetical protein